MNGDPIVSPPLIDWLLFLLVVGGPALALPDVEVCDGRLWAGGQEFIVRGVGYCPWLPAALLPHAKAVMEEDFRRMSRLGFNLIKGWGPLTGPTLELCERHGIYALSAVEANGEYPFDRHETFVAKKLREIEEQLLPNDGRSVILGWNLGSELHDGHWRARNPEIADYLRRARELLRRCSRRPITYGNLSSCVRDLDLSALDLYGLQVYQFSRPVFRRFLADVNQRLAPGQPLLITEFGTSACPQPSGWGRSPLDQGLGYEMQWQEIRRAGAVGGVFFEWNDEWYKGPPGNDPQAQDEHSEEHFGLFEAGRRPKPAVAHVARLFGAIRLVREPPRVAIPRRAVLLVGPQATPAAEATTSNHFDLAVARYLPQALPRWQVQPEAALDGHTAVIVPDSVPWSYAEIDRLKESIPCLGPGEGAILGGEGRRSLTILTGGDGYGLLAAFDRYLDLWRNDPVYRRLHVTGLTGGSVLPHLPMQRYFLDFGPDEDTDVIVVDHLYLRGEYRVLAGEIKRHLERGGGLFVVGGWGTYGGHGKTTPGWAGTEMAQVLPVTLAQPDAQDLDPPRAPRIVQPDHPLARLIDGDFPPIYGFNAERARPGAQVIMALDNGRPILVAGQYGRGRVVCLLTSPSPGWGRAVEKWPGLGRFLRGCVDWVGSP